MLTKLICESCMEVEKTATHNVYEQKGPPCPWDLCNAEMGPEYQWSTPRGCLKIFDYDSRMWEKGVINCPHTMSAVNFSMALKKCLRYKAQVAAAAGILAIVDEEVLS